ncbi:MAG: cupin domain-containing protein [Actinobacteria bacterium]|nr:cupin domain-containing protein [Actinomycetota bacterium]
MPSISKHAAAGTLNLLGIERRYQTFEGHTVAFETYHRDVDLAPLFRGLPGDRCPSPHWGVLRRGKIVFRYEDGEEVIEAGEAYYARPGHTAWVAAGTELVEFSPSGPLEQAKAASVQNLVAALTDPDLLGGGRAASPAAA